MFIIECFDDYCKSMYYKPIPRDGKESTWTKDMMHNYTKKKSLAKLYDEIDSAKKDAENIANAGASVKVWKVKKVETIVDDKYHTITIKNIDKEPVCTFEPNVRKDTTLKYLLPGRIYIISESLDDDGYPVMGPFSCRIEKGSYFSHLGIHYSGYCRSIECDQYYTDPRCFEKLKYRPVKNSPVSSKLARFNKDNVCLDRAIKDEDKQAKKVGDFYIKLLGKDNFYRTRRY